LIVVSYHWVQILNLGPKNEHFCKNVAHFLICYIDSVVFVRIKPSGPRKYFQIVENFREDSKVKQRVIANLGRLEILQQTGQLDRL